MGRSETLSIVVPALNEEGSIRQVLERLRTVRRELLQSGQATEVELLVVDDGSTDHTPAIVREFADVRLIQHGGNRGYGAALKTGFQQARGAYIAFLDADGSYRPESIPTLWRGLRESRADLVVGSRMMQANHGMPRVRYVGNWLFARLLGWLAGQRITDAASGLRIFTRDALTALLPLPDGLHLTPAMSARALHEGLAVAELPIPYDVRAGRSKLHVVRDGLRFAASLLAISRLYNPLKLFGVLGMSILLVAASLSVQPIMHYLQVRHVEETAIYRLFTVMVLVVTGVNVLTFGAFCNQTLTVLYPRRPQQRSVWGAMLLRRRLVRSAGWIGGAFVAAAVALNHQAIREYLFTGQIHVHWSYILTGATLFLTGVQLLMCRFLLTVLGELQECHAGFDQTAQGGDGHA